MSSREHDDRDAGLIDRVAKARIRAEADLLTAAGDRSLCAIARSGEPVPAVKYHEGRVALLSRLERDLRAVGRDAALEGARTHVDSLSDLAAKSPDWSAYRQGALDQLESLEGAA